MYRYSLSAQSVPCGTHDADAVNATHKMGLTKKFSPILLEEKGLICTFDYHTEVHVKSKVFSGI
jgi:hypothetical protein